MAQTDQDPGKELHIACTVGNVPRVSALLAQRFRRDWRDAAYGRTPLISAAASGHTEIVKLLVQDGESDINATDVENSWSALLAAVNFGHRKVVAALLADPRINPNIQSLSGSTALIDACRQADLETVKMLLEPGHWVDPSTSDNKGLSALDYCDGRIEPLILQALDRFIAEQPLPNEDPDETPLLSVEESQKLFHLACFGGHLGRVETFLRDAKLNLNAIDPEFGSSPLAAACLSGRTEIVDRLLEEKRLNPDQRSTAGLTPFMIACQQKHLAIMSSLLMDNRIDANAQTNDKGMTGLMICCETDFLDGIQLLLEFEGKVRLDIKDHSSRTALDYARGQGRELIEALSVVPKGRNSSLNPVPLEPPAAPTMASDRLHDFVEACQRGQLYLVGTYLAMYGPQCNALTTTGTTGFNEACAVGRVAVLDRLLRDPAIDPNVKDSKGRTGFFLACAKGHKEAIKLMLAFAGRIDLEQPCPDSILGRGPFKVTKKPVDVAPSELKQAIRDAIQAASAAKQLERAHILALPPAPLVLPPQPPPSRQPPPMPSSSPHPSLPPQRSPSFVVEAEQEVEVLERRRRGFRGVDSPDSATGSPLTPTFPQQEPSPVQSDTNSSQRRAPPTVPPPRLPRLDNLRGDSQSSSLPSPRSSRHSGSMTSKPRYWIEESDLEIDYKNQLGLEAFKAVYLGTVEVEVRFLDESIPSSKLEADFADWVDMPAHDNVVSLLGYHLESSSFFVTKLHRGGSLTSYMPRLANFDVFALGLLLQIAQGLAFLHSKQVLCPPVPHAIVIDLDSSDLPTAKISRFIRPLAEDSALRFLSPERLGDEAITTASDVWTFGMLAVLLLTGREPYHDHSGRGPLLRAIYSGKRPGKPDTVDAEIWGVIQKCWREDPGARPSMVEVAKLLRDQMVRWCPR